MGQAIGIDLGTTTTIVTYKNRKGKWKQLRIHGDSAIPSVLYFRKRGDEDYCIGREALQLQAQNPHAAVAEFKRHLGDRDYLYEVTAEDGTTFSLRPRKAAILFLQKVLDEAENTLLREFAGDGTVEDAVLTVPAKFNLAQKKETRIAASDSGLADVKLTAEPTAAAVAAAEEGDLPDGESVLVYDFGGGTFDVSVIQRQKGAFHEVATNGLAKLGGSDLTRHLMEQLAFQAEADYGVTIPVEDGDENAPDENEMSLLDWKRNLQYLREAAEQTKIALSDPDNDPCPVTCQLMIRGQLEILQTTVTRAEFENAIRKEIERTMDITRATIQEAHERGIDHIDRFVLAGGSSSIPLIHEMIESELQQQECSDSDEAKTLISKGAAMLANEAELSTDAITNVQYGVVSAEGMMLQKFQPIIRENEPLPCSGTKTFYLARDGQQALDIEYYERDIKNSPRAMDLIETIHIGNLPEGLKKADTQIDVTFTVLLDGVNIDVHVQDAAGNEIQTKNLKIEKGSDLWSDEDASD